MAAFAAAVIFVVVDGGWTRVDAVFTFGRNGFKIDSAGIKCLSTGWAWLPATLTALLASSNVAAFDALVDWLLVTNELCMEFCLPMLTTVAKSRPPPEIHNRGIQLRKHLIHMVVCKLQIIFFFSSIYIPNSKMFSSISEEQKHFGHILLEI